MKLRDLRPGAVFKTTDGIRAVKSEYRYGNEVGSQCQCVLLASGEYAHFPNGNDEEVVEDEQEEAARTYFRWAYAALAELAKDELAKTNRALEDPQFWPCGMSWDQLVGSSQSIFLRKARDRAGIDHAEFLAPIRCGLVWPLEDDE